MDIDWFELSETLINISEHFIMHLTPLLLASGALLAMVSLRNGDIASRARSNVTEMLTRHDQAHGSDREKIDVVKARKRIENLKEQNRDFLARHASTGRICIWIGICITLIPIIILLASFQENRSINASAGAVVIIFEILFVLSGIMLAIEFGRAKKTLRNNNKIVEGLEIKHEESRRDNL